MWKRGSIDQPFNPPQIRTLDELNDPDIASYLSQGDDVTVKVSMDHLISWNLADSKAGRALSTGGWYNSLEE
jgi:hypothetical protein